MTTVAISTLGCKVNAYESESTAQALRQRGYQTVDFKEKADVYIIFTCAVTNTAASKSRQKIHQARRQNPDALVCAVGCYVQIHAEQMSEQEKIDLLIGSSGKDKLPQLIDQALQQRQVPIVPIQDVRQVAEFEMLPLDEFEHQTRAYLKVQDGCNQFCAYCIIPMIRGRHRSRSQQDVVREAETLIRSGVKEICLIAQDITYYGMDKWTDARPNRRSAVDSSRGESLASLLRALNAIEGEFWIRLLYTHPAHWSDELTAAIAECPKVARYVDIPLQHISDNMLDAMQRVTDGDYIRTLLRNIRKAVPGIAIRTTFITGFPGETEDDHQELMEFIEEFRFERAGIFTFSREEGTKAYKMPNQVHHRTKARRYNEATLLLARLASETGQEQIGRQIRVLVDAPGVARTEWDAPDIDGTVSVPLTLPVGQFATVTVTDAVAYELTAE